MNLFEKNIFLPFPKNMISFVVRKRKIMKNTYTYSKIYLISALLFFLAFTGCKPKVKQVVYSNELDHVEQFIETNGYNNNIAILVDFSIHSGKERLFVYDLKTRKVIFSALVSHGRGKGNENLGGVPTVFSNTPNSLLSSLGLATIGARDWSNWGVHFKYWLDGHEASNSNMKKRVVVIHSYGGVPNRATYPAPIITSEGCIMVSNQAMYRLDEIIQSQQNKKIVVYSFQ